MSRNTNAVPEVSLEAILPGDHNLLQPTLTTKTLTIAGFNRRSFSSWGYDFEVDNAEKQISNDSIDMGDSGRINFRTGSFMTRCRRNSKLASQQAAQMRKVTSPTQPCVNWALCQEDGRHSGSENVDVDLNPAMEHLFLSAARLETFRIALKDESDFSPNLKVTSSRHDSNQIHLEVETTSLNDQNLEDITQYDVFMREEQQAAHLSNESITRTLSFKRSSNARKRNHPFRWSSLARSNQPVESSHDTELANFSLNQFLILKKLAMLRLTSVLEKYIPAQRSQFNWKFPKILSTKTKLTDFKADVFGVPLSYWQSRIGQPLPPAIYHAMKFIRQVGPSSDGIFRRAGGKARINELKLEIEDNADLMDFSNWQPYDVADMIKSYFRSLPECLMTNKFSTTLISIITYIPEPQWLETIQCGVINLPDENRLVLQSLLYFLSDLAKHSEFTKMTSFNLAVCLSPSLFHFPHSMAGSTVSPIRMRRSTHGPDPRDLASQKTTHACLKFMIDHAPCLFRISEETINKAHIQLEFDKPISITKLLRDNNDWFGWIRERVDSVICEYHHKFKTWTSVRKDVFKYHQDQNPLCQGFEVFYKKNQSNGDTTNGNNTAIGTWRITANVEAPSSVVLDKILYKRPEWDPEVSSLVVRKDVSDSVDICYMETLSNPPQPNREITVLRGCQRNIDGHISVIVSQSVDDERSPPDRRHPLLQRTFNVQERPMSKITANVFQEDVIVETLSSANKVRINWLSRVDMRGLSSDWYFRQWSHVLIRRLMNLKVALVEPKQ